LHKLHAPFVCISALRCRKKGVCGAWQMDTLPGFEKSDRDPISRAVVLKSLNSSRPLFRVQGFFAESSGRSATQAILVLTLLMLICRVAYHHRIQFLLLPGSPVREVPSASVSKYCTVRLSATCVAFPTFQPLGIGTTIRAALPWNTPSNYAIL